MRFGLLLSLFLIGCANSTNKCGDKVLLVWPDAAGAYGFQEVHIETLSSPYEVKGPAAEVYYEPSFTSAGFEGRVAQPQLTNSDGVCVPTDTGSAFSLAAYAVMERLQKFENQIGTASQVSWPRKIGVDFHMQGKSIDTENNAHYFGDPDVMAVVPYTRSDLPIALNHGIMAHEHFHAHFHRHVIMPLNISMPTVQSGQIFPPVEFEFKVTPESTSALTVNNAILRAWNEGLADFFAGIFTGRANFFTDSLPGAARTRSLDLPLSRLATAGDFEASANDLAAHGLSLEEGLTPYAYGQGARIARLMYRLAHSGVAQPEMFLSNVMKQLEKLPGRLSSNYGRDILEPDSLMQPLLNGMTLNPEACGYLAATLGKNALVKGFGSCAGF